VPAPSAADAPDAPAAADAPDAQPTGAPETTNQNAIAEPKAVDDKLAGEAGESAEVVATNGEAKAEEKHDAAPGPVDETEANETDKKTDAASSSVICNEKLDTATSDEAGATATAQPLDENEVADQAVEEAAPEAGKSDDAKDGAAASSEPQSLPALPPPSTARL